MDTKENAVPIGVTLGIVFVMLGIVWGISVVWILGAIILSIGLLFGTKTN